MNPIRFIGRFSKERAGSLHLLRSKAREQHSHYYRSKFTTNQFEDKGWEPRNRVFTPVRSEDDLTTLLNLPHGRTRRGPLITFWTASFDQQGRTVAEELKSIIESETGSIGNEGDGVGFVEVETDAVTATELAPRYMIDTIPTLMAFRNSMADYKTRVTDMNLLRDTSYLEDWLKSRSAGK